MKASFDTQFDSQFNSLPDDSAALAYSAQDGIIDLGARACVVNRTHRVVRERATAMQARRSHARSLMVPLIICSVLLILTCFAIWTGMYQTQAAEAVQADVSAMANTDSTNHFVVVLLWFVPVSVALLAAVWIHRTRHNSNDEAR
jgi:protein-S-isoprenylcysteine O-methyltransferase Ste14